MLVAGDEQELSFVISENTEIGGTLVQSASVCARQLWLESRKIAQEQDNSALMIGRLIDQGSYRRDTKSIAFGANKFDLLKNENGTLLVGEIKKSSRSIESARVQLCHYLYELSKVGIDARGVLMIPKERRREEVDLTSKSIHMLEDLYKHIRDVCGRPSPPEAQWLSVCPGCAYANFCWS